MRKLFRILAACRALVTTPAFSQEHAPEPPPIERLDTGNWRHWTGLEITPAGAALTGDGTAVFRHPDGPRGSYKHGFRVLNDSAGNWKKRYGVRMEVELADDRAVELAVTVHAAGANGTGESVESRTALRGAG